MIFAHETVPAGFDVLAHVTWIMQIMQAHVFPIALMSHHLSAAANDGGGGFYPPTFHVVTAMVLDLSRVPVYHGVFLSVVAVIAVLPFALFSYVRVATGNTRIAGLATLASLAFEPLPLFTQGLGLYPFVVSLLIVPALAIALRDALGQGDRRAVVLAALLGAGLFYTHPTEFVTVVLLGLAIIPGILRGLDPWLRAVGYALIIAGAWFAAAFPALLAVRNTIVIGAQGEIHATHDFAPKSLSSIGTGLDFYVQWVFGRNASYLLLFAVAVGIAWCLFKRRLLGLALVQVAVSVLFIDSVSLSIFERFYDISFPWALWERLAPTHYWITLPVAAVGIDAAWSGVQRLLRTTDRLFLAIAASPAVILGLLIPFGVSAAITHSYAHARAIVAPSDLEALAWLSRHVSRTTVVANDGNVSDLGTFDAPIDAGRWMPVLDGPQPLFWRDASGPGTVPDRFYLLRHIADAPLPSRAARFATRYDVRYVFYGAQVRPGVQRHLNLTQLLRDPRLSVVYSSAPTCHGRAKSGRMACPPTASYVFALDTANPVQTAAAPAHRQGA